MDYATRQALMEQRNYDNDHRVRAAERGDWFESVDEKRMHATILVYMEDENGDDYEEEVEVPIKFEVCGTCDGKGSHVNPSIDAGGLSYDDFAEDPDFAEEYVRGTYDVPCYECDGKRVSPVIDEQSCSKEQREAVDALYDRLRGEAEDRAIERAERAMGC